LKEITCNFR